MNKTEFIKEFAANAGMTQKDAKEVTIIMFNTLFDVMKRDPEGVSPVQGVKFTTVHKEARDCRNPRTGETVKVPAKDMPKVKFGDKVKELFV